MLFLLRRSVYLDEEFPRRPRSEWRLTVLALIMLAACVAGLWLVHQ